MVWHIGSLPVHSRVLLAPMSGYTDQPFRAMVRRYAPHSLVYTEQLSSLALVNGRRYKPGTARPIEQLSAEDHPIGFQIFGSRAAELAEAARMGEAAGAALIDINNACPSYRINRSGDGCALMNNLPLAAELFKAVVAAVKLPVTVKIRAGWDADHINAPEFAKLAEDSGIQAVTIHGRTRAQRYNGWAEWGFVRATQEAVRIPVIGVGDILTAEQARRRLAEAGCAAVMIGRGVVGRPWIVGQAHELIETGQMFPDPTPSERLRVALDQVEYLARHKGERVGVQEARKHLGSYVKGLPESALFRQEINSLGTLAQVRDCIRRFEEKWAHLGAEVYPEPEPIPA